MAGLARKGRTGRAGLQEWEWQGTREKLERQSKAGPKGQKPWQGTRVESEEPTMEEQVEKTREGQTREGSAGQGDRVEQKGLSRRNRDTPGRNGRGDPGVAGRQGKESGWCRQGKQRGRGDRARSLGGAGRAKSLARTKCDMHVPISAPT